MSAIFPNTEAGVSAELYLFTRDDRIQAYTSADADILYNGRTYKRATIRRSPITGVFSADRTTVTVEASVETVFEFLVTDSVRDSMTLTLYRYNRTAATVLTAFSGVMNSYAFHGSKASVVFQSDGYLLDVEVPKAVQITTCNHTVYGEHCKLELSKWVIMAKVVRTDYWSTGDTTSSSITLEDWAPNARGENLSDISDANLAFSMVEFNGIYRVASSAEPDFIDPADRLMWLTDMFPADSPATGDIVSVIQGCNRDPYTCVNRFNNLSNFLGFPYMPKDREVGEAIPIVYGTQLVNLKNSIWTLHSRLTLGEGPDYTYDYNDASFWAIVCFGPIEWRVLVAPLAGDTILGTGRVDISNAVVRANWIDVSNDGDDGTHPTWSATPYNPLAGAYANELNGVAHVYFASRHPSWTYAILPDTGKPKDVSIEVRRTLAEGAVTPNWIGTEGVTATGVSPAAAIYDLLTNTLYGCGIAAARINLASFNTTSADCATKGFGLNRTWEKAATARKIIDEICDAFGLMLTVDSGGLLYLLMKNTTAALTAVVTLTGDDIADLSLETPAWSETYNNVYTDAKAILGEFQANTVQYLSRIEVNDQANQLFTGSIRKKKVDIDCFPVGEAIWLAPIYKRLQEILNEVSVPHATGTVRVGVKHDNLLPGQAVRIVYPLYNIDGLFRITERDVPEDDSNTLTLAVEQVSGSQFNTDYEETGDESRRTGDPNMTTTGLEALTVPSIGVPDGKTITSTNEYKTLANVYVSWNTPHSNIKFLATQYLSPLDYDVTLNDEGAGPGGDHLVSVTVNLTKYQGVVNLHNNAPEDPLTLYIGERIY